MSDDEGLSGDIEGSFSSTFGFKCHLCVKDLPAGKPGRVRGLNFCSACINAVRCKRRICAQVSLAALASHDAKMTSKDPSTWRAEAMTLVKVDGKRSSSARFEATQSLNEKDDYIEGSKIQDKLLLNKRRFKTWKKQWDGMGSSEASSDFENELLQQESVHSTKKDELVAVDDVMRLRVAEGTRLSVKQQDMHQKIDDVKIPSRIDPCQPGRSRSRRQRHCSPGARIRGATDRPRRRSRTLIASPSPVREAPAVTKRQSAGALGSADELGRRSISPTPSIAATGVASRLRHALPSNVRAFSRGGRRSSLSTLNVDKHNGESADCTSPARTIGEDSLRGMKSRSVPPSVSGSAKKLQRSPLEIMKEKAEFKETLARISTNTFGPKSAAKKLMAAVGKLENREDAGKVIKEAMEANKNCQQISKSLNAMREKVDGMTPHELTAFIPKMEQTMDESDEANSTCNDLSEAIAFISSQGNEQKKKQNNGIRYHRKKMQNRLIGGGWGSKLSKQIVDMLQDKTDDKVEPGLFGKEAAFGWDVTTEISKHVQALFSEVPFASAMDAKKASLSGALVEHSLWGGAMCKIDVELDAFMKMFPEDIRGDFLEDKGACPWLVAVRPWALRYGPSSWPMPGLGSVIMPLGEDVSILILPVREMLAQGVAVPDMMNFTETPSGLKYVQDFGKIINVVSGGALWVPYGWISIAVICKPVKAAGDEDEDDDEEKKLDKSKKPDKAKDTSDDMDAVFMLHFAVFSKVLASKLEDAEWKSVVAFNEDHLVKNQRVKLWTSRFEIFDKFVKSM